MEAAATLRVMALRDQDDGPLEMDQLLGDMIHRGVHGVPRPTGMSRQEFSHLQETVGAINESFYLRGRIAFLGQVRGWRSDGKTVADLLKTGEHDAVLRFLRYATEMIAT